jgi:hypothetical protein
VSTLGTSPAKQDVAALLQTNPNPSMWQLSMRALPSTTVYDAALKQKALPVQPVDVVVVGAGMSGTSLAYWFAKHEQAQAQAVS